MRVTKLMVDDLVERLKSAVPELEIGFKDESKWMKFVGVVCRPFNPRFAVTTLAWYPKIWFPSRAAFEANPAKTAITLTHEAVHLWDTKRDGPFMFRWRYAMPQILAVPMLIGFLLGHLVAWCLDEPHTQWWMLLSQLLLLVLAVLPWSAPSRLAYELRGYGMSVLMHRWMYGFASSEAYAHNVVTVLTSSTYYCMASDDDRAELMSELLRGRTSYVVMAAALQWANDHALREKG